MKIQRLIIIGFLIIISLGRLMPMTLMPEPGDPWYLRYTSIWFFAAGFLLYPSAVIANWIGLSYSRGTAYIVDLIWLIIFSLIIYNFPTRDERSTL